MYVQNMYISHACIAINEECEFKCRWTWINVDKCGWMKFIHNYQTLFICSKVTFIYMLLLTHIVINNTKPSTHSFMWLKLIHIAEIIIYIIKHVSLHALM
jgi:hypothetical protein